MTRRKAREPSPEAPVELPQLPDLPDAAVVCILQHMPLQERLTSCALVCRAWAAAAATAPADVYINLQDSVQAEQLQEWLSKHAGAVTNLTVNGPSSVFDKLDTLCSLQLPAEQLTQLRSLNLSFIKVQLPMQGSSTHSNSKGKKNSSLSLAKGCTSSTAGSSSSSTGSAAAVLPQLQELKLSHCHLTIQLASHLFSATGLTELEWTRAHLHVDDWTSELRHSQLMSAMCEKLVLLPKFSALRLLLAPEKILLEEVQRILAGLEDRPEAPAYLTAIGKLQNLKDLTMVVESHSQAAAVAAVLPTGLTQLHLQVEDLWGGDETAPPELCLTRLSNLHSCILVKVCMQPNSVARLTWLRELVLTEPRHVDDSLGLVRWAPKDLLAVVQQLTQLQHLGLYHCKLWPTLEPHSQSLQPTDCRCFSALTASTQLTSLTLQEWNSMPIPQAAFDYMFPPGRVLPHLKKLYVLTRDHSPSFQVEGQGVEAAQVARIAASCPALQQLGLHNVTPRNFDVQCLLQLPPGVTEVWGLDWKRPEPRRQNPSRACRHVTRR